MIHLCPKEPRFRAISNGSIPLFLGRDTGKIAPQVRLFDIMISRPFPVGFFAFERITDAPSFIADTVSNNILFLNVYNSEPPQQEVPLLFFNISGNESYYHIESPRSILFFNVIEENSMIKEETILFFNVSEKEVCE